MPNEHEIITASPVSIERIAADRHFGAVNILRLRQKGLRPVVAGLSHNRLVCKSFEQFLSGGINGYC